MDEDTIELLGALYDDELAGDYEDELAGFDDELLGFDMDDDGDVMGAFRLPKRLKSYRSRARSRGRSRGRSRISPRAAKVQRMKAAYINKLAPALPGVPAPGARNFPLGFGSVTFQNGGATSFNLVANPQRPFKGARLVIDVRRSAGALAELVTVTSLNIGQNNQLVSAAALPAEAFRPDGFDTMLSLDPATPGIDIVLGLSVSAQPGAGETITVSAMIIGNTIG